MARIDDLKDTVTTLTERVNTLLKELKAVTDAHAETARLLADMRREYDKEIALLKREIEDLRKWKDDQKKQQDEHSRRLWAFGPNLLAAFISGLIAFVVAYLTARH